MTDQTNETFWTEELDAQKKVAFTAGLLLSDVTVQNFLESITEAVVLVEAGGRMVVTNTAAEELFGYTKQELIGQRVDMLIPEHFGEAHREHISKFFENPRSRPTGRRNLLVGKGKNGEQIPLEVALGYLQTPAGQLSLALMADAGDRKQSEEKLRESIVDLEAFASTVAHDLTNPLAGLVAASDILAGSDKDSPLTSKLIDEIGAVSRNLVSVVRELLAFAVLSAADIETVPLDMDSIVDQALDRLKMETMKRGACIVRQAHMPSALGYGPWLEEIWFNYLANAIKYGGETPAIEIGGEADPKGMVRFWVRDQGPGIPAERAESLFRKGQSIPHAEGYGLGLPIVARIADRLGGEVFVETDTDKGSCFGFVLPAATSAEERHASAPA